MPKNFVRLAVLTMLLTGCAGEKPVGHDASGSMSPARTAIPDYETAEQLKAISPCKAVVENRAPCCVLLRTTSGSKFYIGSPGAAEEVRFFLQTLRDGKVYDFPSAFLEYLKHDRKDQ